MRIRSHYRKVKRGRVVVRSHVRRRSGEHLYLAAKPGDTNPKMKNRMKDTKHQGSYPSMMTNEWKPGIYIGRRHPHLEDNPDNLKLLADIIGHEELHRAIYKAKGQKASRQLDRITVPVYTHTEEDNDKMPLGVITNPKSAHTISIPLTQFKRGSQKKGMFALALESNYPTRPATERWLADKISKDKRFK